MRAWQRGEGLGARGGIGGKLIRQDSAAAASAGAGGALSTREHRVGDGRSVRAKFLKKEVVVEEREEDVWWRVAESVREEPPSPRGGWGGKG